MGGPIIGNQDGLAILIVFPPLRHDHRIRPSRYTSRLSGLFSSFPGIFQWLSQFRPTTHFDQLDHSYFSIIYQGLVHGETHFYAADHWNEPLAATVYYTGFFNHFARDFQGTCLEHFSVFAAWDPLSHWFRGVLGGFLKICCDSSMICWDRTDVTGSTITWSRTGVFAGLGLVYLLVSDLLELGLSCDISANFCSYVGFLWTASPKKTSITRNFWGHLHGYLVSTEIERST